MAIVLVLAAAGARVQANPILAALTIGLTLVAWHRTLLAWPALLGYVIVVILVFPIRRYTLGGGLPFALEPYRLLIALVLCCWAFALLADPKTRWRRIGVERPVLIFLVALVGGLALNIQRIVAAGVTAEVIKGATFFASFLLVMYFTATAVRTRRHIDAIVVLLVIGGTVLGVAATYEWRTEVNLFTQLERVVPALEVDPVAAIMAPDRGGRVRAHASAQHPIALGAALVLLMPLAIYLFRRRRNSVWLGAAAIMTLGSLATGSRTAAVMLAVELIVFFWIKRAETVKMLPLLLPLIVAAQFLMPGTLGTLKATLTPSAAVAEQGNTVGVGSGAGRIADLAPSLEEFKNSPFLGQGFGTRLTSESDVKVNARILDNEWLGLLLEVGIVGVLALLWLYIRAVRRLARRGRRDSSPHGWLLASLAAALAAYAVGMLTYDAYSFVQVTFLSFMMIGLAAVALRLADEPDDAST